MCVTSVNSTITITTVPTTTATDITTAPATERIGPLNRAIVRKIINFRQFQTQPRTRLDPSILKRDFDEVRVYTTTHMNLEYLRIYT